MSVCPPGCHVNFKIIYGSICFSMSGYLDETLALVLDMSHLVFSGWSVFLSKDVGHYFKPIDNVLIVSSLFSLSQITSVDRRILVSKWICTSGLKTGGNEWVARNWSLQRVLGSLRGKHCNSLQRNVRRKVVSTSKKAIFARDYGFFAVVLSYMDKDMLIWGKCKSLSRNML